MLNLFKNTSLRLFLFFSLILSSFSATAAPIQPGVSIVYDVQFQKCLDEAVLNNGWTSTEEVTSLVCQNRGIKNLDGIEVFGNLTQLDLSNNKLIHISPIQSLSLITKLNLTGNTILDPFEVEMVIQNKIGLTHLGVGGIAMGNDLNWLPGVDLLELDISNIGELYNLYPIVQYANLRVLRVADNHLFDIYPLIELEQLEVLDLSRNELGDVSWLQFLNNLKQLSLSNNMSLDGASWIDVFTIDSILSANPMLTHLGLAGIDIGDLNQLNSFNFLSLRLIELDISNTSIHDLSPLFNFIKLRALIANNNLIENIYGLEQLPLTTLELSNNKLKYIGGTISPELEVLDLSRNKLLDIYSLQFLNQLTQLNISGNYLLNPIDIQSVVYNNTGLTSLSLADINIGGLSWLPPTGANGEYDFKFLDISNTGEFDDLLVVSQYKNLHSLKASGNSIKFLAGFEQLDNLEVLDISNNNLFDVAALQVLNKLSELNLSGNKKLFGPEVAYIIQNNRSLTHLGVAGISMGEYLNWLPSTSLQGDFDFIELDISNTGVVFDLYPISQYVNLRVLKVAGNEVWDTWPLAGLQQLEVLDLSNNLLGEVSSLQNLRNLTQLTLSNNKTINGLSGLGINDINPILGSNPKLTHIGLAGISIGDLSQLDIFNILSNNIKEIDVSNTNIVNLDSLWSLQNLEVLKASDNAISYVFGLEQLPLRVLELSNNQITNLGMLDGRQQLKVLDLSGNQLLDISSLSTLTKLTELNLTGNQQLAVFNIQTIIQANTGLTHIGVGGISMGNLNWLPSKGPQDEFDLVELDISNTGSFFDLQPLAQFSNLKVIKAAANQIQVVGLLESLQQLEIIDLTNNELFDIASLQALNNLTQLSLSGNKRLNLYDVQPIIQSNTGLTHIHVAEIKMNDLYWIPAATVQGEFNLVELDVSNVGELVDLYPLLQQPNLKVLKIAGNNIWDSWGIDQLMQLEILDLSNNDLLYLSSFTNLMDLLSVDLRGNNNLQCNELDLLEMHLETKLPVGVLFRPVSCILFMPPEISILNPLNESYYFDSEVINFIAVSNDFEDGDLSGQIVWASNKDGTIGTGGVINKQLTAGSHTISATVTDSHGNKKSMSVGLTVLLNSTPQLNITSIFNGALFNQGETVLLAADAIDSEDGVISHNIQWSSNIDGLLGGGASLQSVLSVGDHIIQAKVVDAAGASVTQSVSLSINALPELLLLSPTVGSLYQQDTSVTLLATATDTEDGDLAASIHWSSSIDGVLGSGNSVQKILSVGSHVITAFVSDSAGASVQQTVTFIVNSAPQLTVLSPLVGGLFNQGDIVSLVAAASDSEDGDLSQSVNWSSNIDGVLGTGGNIQKALSVGDHIITANVVDSDGASSTETIALGVNALPQLTLSSPITDSVYQEGASVSFTATANDAEDGDISANISWSSNIDGVIGVGAFFSKVMSVGTHIITVTIADSNGIASSKNVNVLVNAAPSLSLISPVTGSLYMLQETVELSATANDLEDGVISSNIKWVSNIDGVLGISASFNQLLSLGTHELTASITDSVGVTRSVSTQVIIDQIALSITVKSRGSRKKAILTWSGSRTDVDIYKDGVVIDIESASGSEDYRFRGTSYFKVCERNTIYCSKEVLAE